MYLYESLWEDLGKGWAGRVSLLLFLGKNEEDLMDIR